MVQRALVPRGQDERGGWGEVLKGRPIPVEVTPWGSRQAKGGEVRGAELRDGEQGVGVELALLAEWHQRQVSELGEVERGW